MLGGTRHCGVMEAGAVTSWSCRVLTEFWDQPALDGRRDQEPWSLDIVDGKAGAVNLPQRSDWFSVKVPSNVLVNGFYVADPRGLTLLTTTPDLTPAPVTSSDASGKCPFRVISRSHGRLHRMSIPWHSQHCPSLNLKRDAGRYLE